MAEPMSDDQIKYMVDRFLSWRLPDDFRPDAGISFASPPSPTTQMPIGTNLFTAGQAEAMVRYLIEGLPSLTREEVPKASSDDPMCVECGFLASEHHDDALKFCPPYGPMDCTFSAVERDDWTDDGEKPDAHDPAAVSPARERPE